MATRRILVVDDSKMIRRAVAMMLSKGYACFEAADGEEALAILEREHVDLVLTDLYMPNMDGFEFLDEMRSLAGCGRTPVVVLTTEKPAEVIRDLQRHGVDGVLQKPIDRGSLNAELERRLGANHRRQR